MATGYRMRHGAEGLQGGENGRTDVTLAIQRQGKDA
jgi:hypothetical protein